MTDGDALLAAILACPEDDSVRLVYADWLQEDGQEDRAEFIRVQVALAKYEFPRCEEPKRTTINGNPWRIASNQERVVESRCNVCDACRWTARSDKATSHLRERSGELLAAHADDWVPRANALWDWHRGFVRGIDGIATADWLAHGDEVLAAHPVRKVVWTRFTFGDRCEIERRFLAAGGSSTTERPFTDIASEVWPGVAFDIRVSSVATVPLAPGATVQPGDLLGWNEHGQAVPLAAPFDTTGSAQAANYAAAKASEAAFNAVIGGILENMIVQDGILPGGGDEEEEEEDE